MAPMAALAALTLAAFPLAANAHGYIKSMALNGGAQWQPAQKTDRTLSAWRSVSNNTGFVGSLHLDSMALVCGAFQTPFASVAAPSGPYFHTPDQSAGLTANINAGGTVSLVIAGRPGAGWPHYEGNHMLAYLGYCGPARDACQNIDAATLKYFKIMQKARISDDLRMSLSPQLDGNVLNVTIPSSVRTGSYIMRFELIAFDVGTAEGYQDELYRECASYCGHFYITSTGNDLPDGVTFPDVYRDDARIQGGMRDYLPGPQLAFAEAGSSSSTPMGAIIGGAVGGGLALLAALGLICFCRRRRQRQKRWQTGDLDAEVDEHSPSDYERPKVDSFITSPVTSPHSSSIPYVGATNGGLYAQHSSAGTPSLYSDGPEMREPYVPPPVPLASTRPVSMVPSSRPMSSDSSYHGHQSLISPDRSEHGDAPGSPSAASSIAGFNNGLPSPKAPAGFQLANPQADVKRPEGPDYSGGEGVMPTVHEDAGPADANMTDIPPIYHATFASGSRS